MTVLDAKHVPNGEAPLNPFIVVDDAPGFVTFLVEVFGGVENQAARTPMPDGRLIHAEVALGGPKVMLSDRLDGWPTRPGLLQVWVGDVGATLGAAAQRGARIVTPPSPFYGETTLGRMRDPWGNLWWLYAPAAGQPDPVPAWEGGDDIIFRTIDQAMKELAAERSEARVCMNSD